MKINRIDSPDTGLTFKDLALLEFFTVESAILDNRIIYLKINNCSPDSNSFSFFPGDNCGTHETVAFNAKVKRIKEITFKV